MEAPDVAAWVGCHTPWPPRPPTCSPGSSPHLTKSLPQQFCWTPPERVLGEPTSKPGEREVGAGAVWEATLCILGPSSMLGCCHPGQEDQPLQGHTAPYICFGSIGRFDKLMWEYVPLLAEASLYMQA